MSSYLQTLFDILGKGKSYGSSTTHVGKLLPKIVGGGAAECPILVFAITKNACIETVKEAIKEVKENTDSIT